jgi:ribonuclease R
MLPEVLSNFACSLRPNEENILFSVFEITDKCEVVDQWFGRTVIYSDQRFVYEEAQYIIETKDNTMPEEISISGNSYVSDEIVDATLKMNQLARIFRRNRMNDGVFLLIKSK